ncbi:5-oxoprolinase subunit PxpB [Pantoea sp. 18069]|uniref:5-oxoprolinase subunit PxpB n=1 Tax=Pantoea sp. 18069 TaxID=2681415 RepID=UPI0013580BF6|nr:5-oxoprolinase subunit PxpB [Pantoea sp. 18069]
MSRSATPSVQRLSVSALGTHALLFETSGPLDAQVQQRILALADAAAGWSEVQEAVPGMNNLMLVFDSASARVGDLEQRVQRAWTSPVAQPRTPRVFELPVVYGGEQGPDLAHVARHNGLSTQQVIELHSRATYTVFCLGAHPGFAYLGGLDARLHTPRRAQPRLKVRAGSVAIGGAQAGVQAQTLPSGWNLIGFTDRKFFDPTSAVPALLAPGDVVRFRAVEVLS